MINEAYRLILLILSQIMLLSSIATTDVMADIEVNTPLIFDKDGNKVNEQWIRIYKQIKREDVSTLQSLLKKPTNSIELDSLGGDALAALDIGDIVYNSKNVPVVYVENSSSCGSACVLLLASVKDRHVDGNIYVHRPYSTSNDIQFKETKREHDNLRRKALFQFKRAGVSERLWEMMMSTSSQNARLLTPNEVSELGLDKSEPAYQDYKDSIKARELGISKQEYYKRLSIFERCMGVESEHLKRFNNPTEWGACLTISNLKINNNNQELFSLKGARKINPNKATRKCRNKDNLEKTKCEVENHLLKVDEL